MQKKASIYTNYTKAEIVEYLKKLKEIIKNGNYYIPENDKRIKNRMFIEKYGLDSKRKKEMLLALEVSDFCYSIDNDDNIKERLYIFAKEYSLDNWGMTEKRWVYIKVVIKENNYAVVISFHEPEKKVRKLFE